jgi:hypothetical protein
VSRVATRRSALGVPPGLRRDATEAAEATGGPPAAFATNKSSKTLAGHRSSLAAAITLTLKGYIADQALREHRSDDL